MGSWVRTPSGSQDLETVQTVFFCLHVEFVKECGALFVNKSVILNCLNVELTDFDYADNKDRHIVSART